MATYVLLFGKYWQRLASVAQVVALSDGHGVVSGPHTDGQLMHAVPLNWHCGSAEHWVEIMYELHAVATPGMR